MGRIVAKTGLLLVNLGSPSSPAPDAIRKYLFQFLHDKRVIKLTRWIWCPILHFIILRVRPKKVAKAYASIWAKPDGALSGDLNSEAPLIRITRAQAKGLQERLGANISVEIAMRYGSPSIESAIKELKSKGCERIAILPAYPQFSHTTVSSVRDEVEKVLGTIDEAPEMRFLDYYYDDPRYISALAQSINTHLDSLGWTPDAVIASYHGVPRQYIKDGDPYEEHCNHTTELLREHMEIGEDYLRQCFQSRFGPSEWLTPYLDKTLEILPKEGVKNIAIVAPAFSADCLETLEEIAEEGEEIFHEHGGKKFTMIPCLNDDSAHMDALAGIAKDRLLKDWIA